MKKVKTMENKIAQDIIEDFLDGIEKYLRDNINTLSCYDIRQIYYHLFLKLKQYKGNSAGFTGFSELIIFRFLFHLLNGFEIKEYPNTKETRYFLKEHFTIYQSVRPLKAEKSISNMMPDILIMKADKPIAAIEIKIYLSGGKKTVIEAFNRLRLLYESNPDDFWGQLLIFTYHKPKRAQSKSIHTELISLQHKNPWFNFLLLQNEKALFKDCLNNSLKLYRIQKDL